MILKLLLIVAVIATVYFFFIKKKPSKNIKNKEESKEDTQESSDMIECSYCGVYAELGDSLLSDSKYYCSRECLKAAK